MLDISTLIKTLDRPKSFYFPLPSNLSKEIDRNFFLKKKLGFLLKNEQKTKHGIYLNQRCE